LKTLYLISKGMNKPSTEEVLEQEKAMQVPRQSLLEMALHADLLDERYLFQKAPAYRQWIYHKMPVFLGQVLEALFICKRYDVILSQSEKVALPLALMMRILHMKTPHIAIISRITSTNEAQSKRKKWFLKQTRKSISRYLLWSSVQSKIAIEELGIAPEKVTLIKRGVDQEFWKENSAPVETDMICSVGMEERDYPTLVKAVTPLDNIPCHIATGTARGELFESVRKLYEIDNLAPHITVGVKAQSELRELYRKSRFTVVSLRKTDSDNGLTTILETMAMGKPVICSRVEGQVDVIIEGETGIYVPQGDPDALRRAIVELWNDPVRCRNMGMEARKYIEQNHSLETFVGRIREVAVEEYERSARVDMEETVKAATHQ
jgi:glycosyltransferase involved in cell wall biosynthesis